MCKLIQHCKLRHDGKDDIFEKATNLTIHKLCRNEYTKPWNIKLLKPRCGKATTGTPWEINSLDAIRSKFPSVQNGILFLHAFTGCDYNSAIFKKGKTQAWKIFQEEPDLIEYVRNAFNNPNSSHEDVHKEGSNFLSCLYGAKEGK